MSFQPFQLFAPRSAFGEALRRASLRTMHVLHLRDYERPDEGVILLAHDYLVRTPETERTEETLHFPSFYLHEPMGLWLADCDCEWVGYKRKVCAHLGGAWDLNAWRIRMGVALAPELSLRLRGRHV